MRLFRQSISTKWVYLLFVCFSLFSCTHQVSNSSPTITVTSEKSTYPDISLQDRNLPEEINKYENILTKNPDRKTLARTYLRLASLYSSYKNPSPDYARAFRLLKDYSDLEPDKARSETFQYWFFLLSSLNTLQERFSHLQKENAEIKAVLEQLKHLDIRIEERRKQVK